MALARPGNKNMAMAFIQTYAGMGAALGRNLTSVILAIGLLAPQWTLGKFTFNHYQSMFMIYGVIALIIFMLLPIMPSVISKHEDHYEP
jgi:hypothetical protein